MGARRRFGSLGHLGKAGGGAFTPAQLTGLVAWYKADVGVFSDAGVTPAVNSGNVQQWNDQSGHGYNLIQATTANKPTFLTAGLNSKPAVSFAQASNQFVQTALSTVVMGTGTTGSGFAVLQMTSAVPSNGTALSYAVTAGSDFNAPGNARFINRATTTNAIGSFRNSVAGPSSAVSLSTTVHIGTVYDGTNATSWLNNVSGGTGAQTSAWATNGAIVIGSAQNAGNAVGTGSSWDGPISEVVITTSALSSTDRANLEAYFTSRW